MTIGLLKELADTRVAMIPEIAAKFIKAEHGVWVESGAGESAGFSDKNYKAAGAEIKNRTEILSQAEVVVGVNAPEVAELKTMKAGAWAVAMFNVRSNPDLPEQLKAVDIRTFSMDMIPRTSIAQSMDVLSSMASLAGYKSVLVAATRLPRYMPMLMTSAGTIPPARVLILGAGVAGLQAIATSRKLGAIVEVFDVRSAVKEEVLSLGAKFVEVEGVTEDKGAGGYAVEQSEDYKKRQTALIQEKAIAADIIITTANIPGRKAPILIHAETVEKMKSGAVIVDLAAVTGGNCELTENGKTVVKHGVSLIGDSNLPASMPDHASKLYSNNVYNFLTYILKESPDGLNFENEIIKGTCFNAN